MNKDAEETFLSYKQQCTEKEKYLSDQLNTLKAAEKRNRGELLKFKKSVIVVFIFFKYIYYCD
jgi:hypothetical protein